MKNLKVWIKLSIGFGIVLSILCALGLQAIRQMEGQRQSAVTVAEAFMPELVLAVQFERAAQMMAQNMLAFTGSGNEKYYTEARKHMQALEKVAREARALVTKFPFLTRLAENLNEAQKSFEAYQVLAEKTHTLVIDLNERRVRQLKSAEDFFTILRETLDLAEKALEVTILDNKPHAEILTRAKSIYLLNEAINLGNVVEGTTTHAQTEGDPEIAVKGLGTFTQLFNIFAQLQSNALPHNRERVAKVAVLTEAYRTEMTAMITEWRELKAVTAERSTLNMALQNNAQNTSSEGIHRVQSLCVQATVFMGAAIQQLTTGLAVGVVLGIFFAWWLTRMITKPLEKTVNFAEDVANGNLQEHLSIEGQDEIGNLAKSLNIMVTNLTARIRMADEATQEATVRKEEATEAMRQAEHARTLAEQAKRQGMLDAAGQLEDIVATLSLAAEQLAAQVEQASRGAQQQATRVGDAATSMEEMSASVLDVAQNTSITAEVSNEARMKAAAGAEVVNDVVSGMERISGGALELRQDMEKLSAKAESIGSILNVISDIADQTNLLALNAAIEAARAGEAGRGFAVVADEVRKLAEKTMHATSEVGEAISGIQEGTTMNMTKVESTVTMVNEVREMASHSGQVLTEIVVLVDRASEQIRGIATASEQQSATSESINKAVGEVNQIATETATTMQESGHAVRELNRQSRVLTELIENMKQA